MWAAVSVPLPEGHTVGTQFPSEEPECGREAPLGMSPSSATASVQLTVGHGASSTSPARHWSWDVDEWLSLNLVSRCLQVVSVPESHVVSAGAQRAEPPGITEGGGWTPTSEA